MHPELVLQFLRITNLEYFSRKKKLVNISVIKYFGKNNQYKTGSSVKYMLNSSGNAMNSRTDKVIYMVDAHWPEKKIYGKRFNSDPAGVEPPTEGL